MILRSVVFALVIVTLLLVEAVIAPAAAIRGVAPDLLVLAVVGVALARGPATGTLFGFAAGVARDLLAPVPAVMGPWILALLCVGYGAGVIRRLLIGPSLLRYVTAGVGGATAASLLAGLLQVGLGAGAASPVDVLLATLIVGAWAVVLAPVICGPAQMLSTAEP